MPAGGYTTAARCAWQAYNVHSGEAICLGGTQLRGFIRAGGDTAAGPCVVQTSKGRRRARRRAFVFSRGYEAHTAASICAWQASNVNSCGALCSLGVHSGRALCLLGVHSGGALFSAGVQGVRGVHSGGP